MLASSLGIEDVILMEIIVQQNISIDMFTLETGRLPEETLTLLQQLQDRYQNRIKVYFPQAEQVESYVNQHGINGFYQSIDLRKRCCYIRKVEPLQRAGVGRRQGQRRRRVSGKRRRGDNPWKSGSKPAC